MVLIFVDSAQVAGRLIDDRRLRPSERVRAVIGSAEANPGDPLIHQPRILPRAEVFGMVGTAREGGGIERASSTLQPGQDAGPSGFQQLELHGPAGLLLDDDRASAYLTAADEVADLDLDDVTSAQLAVDRQVEHRTVA